MTRPHWSNVYLGLPWLALGRTPQGIDCWGLVALIYQRELGIEVPSYRGTPIAAERNEIAAALTGGGESWPWFETEVPREFDLVSFRLGEQESHFGVIVWPGAFLHAAEGITSRIERLGNERWRPMLGRFLRHRSCHVGSPACAAAD